MLTWIPLLWLNKVRSFYCLELDLVGINTEFKSKKEREEELKEKKDILMRKDERKWMVQRGKKDLLDFTDDQIKKLKECFDSLDDNSSG